MRPNILLVVLDTARADAFEPYGAPAGSSPVLGDIARRGGHVPQAYASGSWTVPSHVGMFTGRLARSVGLGQAPDGSFRSTRPQMERLADELLPATLRRGGYTTAGVSCNAWISPMGGWDIGFDDFTHVPSPRSRPHGHFSRRTGRWLHEVAIAELDNGARRAEQVMREWFRHWDGKRPFFWFVNLMECHGPYLPPRPYNDLNVVRRLLAGRDSIKYQPFEAVLRQNLAGIEASAASLARMEHLYARSIVVIDDWIDRLSTFMSERGILDDTALVITSDHGENFGEGGRIGHGFSLNEHLVHVPLITHGPISTPEGRPWSLLGLPSLLCDTAGVGSGRYESPPDGHPVAAQFDPLASAGDPRVAEVRRDWDLDDGQIRMVTEPLTMVTDGDGKLVRLGEETWYHDLAADPHELEQLPASRAPRELHHALEAESLWATAQDSTDTADRTPEADPEEIAALEEQMRLLGYM